MYTLLVAAFAAASAAITSLSTERDNDGDGDGDDGDDDDKCYDYNDYWRSVLTTMTMVPRGSSGVDICFVSFCVEQ